MKKILLSSAAIALLAGAASAEVTWSGDAEIGYNDDWNDGAYYDAGLTVNLSQELNNGWTASASLDIDLESDTDTTYSMGTVDSSDWVLTLSNDMFALSFGDVDTAYASFSGVSALYDNDFFAPFDEAADYAGTTAGILVTGSFGMVSGALSYVVVDDGAGEGTNDGDLDGAQLYLGAEFGMVDAGLFYDDVLEMTVVNLGTTLAGAEFNFSVMDYFNETGYGIDVSYPVGPVTLGAYFASVDSEEAYGVSAEYSDGPITVAAYYNEEFLGEAEYALEGAYDFGSGLVVTAGYIDGDSVSDNDYASYVVAEYDLGGGASFLASYADANNAAAVSTDDIDTGLGGYELKSGATLALSFSF